MHPMRLRIHYILDESGDPVQCSDFLIWAAWWERTDRTLSKSILPDGVEVSTVFMGLDHQWGDGPPLLWETMVFGGPYDQEQVRYHTRQQALAGHAQMVARVRGGS